jgi:tetratricopeptide (TPR) repeat protein
MCKGEKAACLNHAMGLKFTAELVDFGELVDVSDMMDRGVTKRTLVEASGTAESSLPMDLARVCASLSVRSVDKKEELSSLPSHRWALDTGEVPEGLDMAVKTMRVGDKALVTIAPLYIHGGAGDASMCIAKGYSTCVEVSLESCENPKHPDDMSLQERLDACAEGKEDGNLCFKAGEYGRARRRYDRVVLVAGSDTTFPEGEEEKKKVAGEARASALGNRSQCDLNLGDYAACLQDCHAVLMADPGNIKAIYRTGCAHLELKDWDMAEMMLKKVVEWDPENKPAAKKLKDLAARKKEQDSKDKDAFKNMFSEKKKKALYDDAEPGKDAAASGTEAAAASAAPNPYAECEDAFTVGKAKFEEGDIADAILALEAYVLKSESDTEGWRYLGLAHAENDDDDKAIECLENAISVDKGNNKALVALSVSYVNNSKPQDARRVLTAWVNQNDEKFSELGHGGDDALSQLKEMMALAAGKNKLDADIRLVMGVLQASGGDLAGAIASFEEATALEPDDYGLWNKLGAVRANLQDPGPMFSEAIPAYRNALKLKPKYTRAWANMALSYAALDQAPKACKCYLEALRLNPSAQQHWASLRIALGKMGKEELVEKTQAQNPELFVSDFELDRVAPAPELTV